MRADVQLPGGTGGAGQGSDGGAGDAFHQEDMAAQVSSGEIRRVAVAEIAHRRRKPRLRRWQREGMGDRRNSRAVDRNARFERQADIRVVAQHFGAVAISCELRLDGLQARQLIGAAGELHALGEQGAGRHELWPAHGIDAGSG